MVQSTKALGAACLVLLPVVALGCRERTGAPGLVPVVAGQKVAPLDSTTPREIELSGAVVTTVEPALVQLEVNYRFSQGQPQPGSAYRCEITFPVTACQGVRLIEGWVLNAEGTIQDWFTLSDPGAKSFEFRVSVGPSLQGPFKGVSNVASGPVK